MGLSPTSLTGLQQCSPFSPSFDPSCTTKYCSPVYSPSYTKSCSSIPLPVSPVRPSHSPVWPDSSLVPPYCSTLKPCGVCSRCQFLTSYQSSYGSPRNSPRSSCKFDLHKQRDLCRPSRPTTRSLKYTNWPAIPCPSGIPWCRPWNLCTVCRHQPRTSPTHQTEARPSPTQDIKTSSYRGGGGSRDADVSHNKPKPQPVHFDIPYKGKIHY